MQRDFISVFRLRKWRSLCLTRASRVFNVYSWKDRNSVYQKEREDKTERASLVKSYKVFLMQKMERTTIIV